MKTTFSRRELYALGEPIGDSATVSKVGGGRIYGMGGGGGGGQTTSTSYQTNIPEYAQPYVETMLGATQRQLFEGNETGDGGFNITGFKPYQPYSGSADDYVAGFSPMQQQSQRTIAGMQVPGQYQTAADITGAGIMGAADLGNQARAFSPMAQQAAGMGQQYQQMATDPNAISAYMSPYMQNVVDTQQQEAQRQADIATTGRNAQAVGAGAFGGSRQAITDAEAARNLATQKGSIQAQGLQNAYQQAQQAQQYGMNLGLQGLQTGAGIYGQGLNAQQQALQMAMSGAGQLAGLGGQAFEAQKSIAGLQGSVGAQQQQMEQQKINQRIQDYANAQQYPLMQLGTMSNMLRGLPMQAQTTNQYMAAPNPVTQGIGMAGAGASLYNAYNPPSYGGRGYGYAKGGITSVPKYDVGGEVESDLESMPNEALAKQAKESPSPIIRQKAQRILRERQMEQGSQGMQYQAPEGMASGGIIAFKKGEEVTDTELANQNAMYIAAAEARAAEARAAEEARNNPAEAPAPAPTRGGFYNKPASNTVARPYISRGSVGATNTPTSPSRGYLSKTGAPAGIKTALPSDMDSGAAVGDMGSTTPVAAAAPASIKTVPRPAAPATAPAPTQAGIKGASQEDMDAGAAVGGVGSTMPATGIQAAAEAAQARADRPLSAFEAEQEAERKRLGLDKNVGQEEYRKQVMGDQASAKAEAEQQKWMRAAQFFAKWGSTPGATLVAGMKALEASIPGFIEDAKEQKKAKRESDKILYTLEEATRQEKLGNLKEATALKEKAAQTAMHLQQSFSTQQTSAASDASRERSSKYTADMHLKAEEARSAAAAADRAQRRGEAGEEQKYRNYSILAKNEENVLARIAAERSDKDYQALQQKANVPDTATGPIKTQRDDAIAKMKVIEDGWATRAKNAADRTEAAKIRATGEASPEPTGKGISKAEFDKLPSGARFTAPDGSIRTKP